MNCYEKAGFPVSCDEDEGVYEFNDVLNCLGYHVDMPTEINLDMVVDADSQVQTSDVTDTEMMQVHNHQMRVMMIMQKRELFQ